MLRKRSSFRLLSFFFAAERIAVILFDHPAPTTPTPKIRQRDGSQTPFANL
jgi:hypothetical protein